MTIVIFKTKKNDFLKWKAAHRWQFCLDEKKWEKIMHLLNMLKCRRTHFCYWKYQEGLYATFHILTFWIKSVCLIVDTSWDYVQNMIFCENKVRQNVIFRSEICWVDAFFCCVKFKISPYFFILWSIKLLIFLSKKGVQK